jgi:hypothetical protein
MTTQLWGGLGEAIFGRFWSRTFSLSFNIHLLSPLSRSVALREDIGLIRATIQMYYFFDVNLVYFQRVKT